MSHATLPSDLNRFPCGDSSHSLFKDKALQAIARKTCRAEKMALLDANGGWHTVHQPWAANKTKDKTKSDVLNTTTGPFDLLPGFENEAPNRAANTTKELTKSDFLNTTPGTIDLLPGVRNEAPNRAANKTRDESKPSASTTTSGAKGSVPALQHEAPTPPGSFPIDEDLDDKLPKLPAYWASPATFLQKQIDELKATEELRRASDMYKAELIRKAKIKAFAESEKLARERKKGSTGGMSPNMAGVVKKAAEKEAQKAEEAKRAKAIDDWEMVERSEVNEYVTSEGKAMAANAAKFRGARFRRY